MTRNRFRFSQIQYLQFTQHILVTFNKSFCCLKIVKDFRQKSATNLITWFSGDRKSQCTLRLVGLELYFRIRQPAGSDGSPDTHVSLCNNIISKLRIFGHKGAEFLTKDLTTSFAAFCYYNPHPYFIFFKNYI